MKSAAIQLALAPISTGSDLILKASAAGRRLVLLIMRQQRLFITRLFAGSRLSILSLTVPLLFGWQRATPGLQRYIEVLQVSVKHGDQRREKHLPGTSPHTYPRRRRLLLTCHIPAQRRPPTQPRLAPYPRFNSVWRERD